MAAKHSSLTTSVPRRNKPRDWKAMQQQELAPPGAGSAAMYPD